MKLLKKLNGRRGTTLVEVLMAVALMAIMLAVAMPNLLSESQAIKLTAMNGYARSVAVAVQSRLYGMKNSGTSLGSEYRTLNDEVATEVSITADGKSETVKCVSNFGKKGTQGKEYLLSGALTDTEVLQKGKIAVLYNPETANIIQTYYSENDFDILLGVDESYRKSHAIGIYKGENASAIDRESELPKPFLKVKNGEELLAEVEFSDINPKLYDRNVALEFYIANAKNPNQKVLIYSEGARTDGKQIPLSSLNGQTLSLALDSYVLTNMPNSNLAYALNCFYSSGIDISALNSDDYLYPRQQFDMWLNRDHNIYMRDWAEVSFPKQIDKIVDYFNATKTFISTDFFDMREDGAFEQWLQEVRNLSLKDISDEALLRMVLTNYSGTKGWTVLRPDYEDRLVKVGDDIQVTVEIHALNESEIISASGGNYYGFDDENLPPKEMTSINCNAYYYSDDKSEKTVQVASVRHMQNLADALKNDLFRKAELIQPIDVDEVIIPIYDGIRAGLEENYSWMETTLDSVYGDKFFHNYIARFAPLSAQNFTFDGKGNALKNIYASSYGVTGIFGIAYNCTLQNLRLCNVGAGSMGLDRRNSADEKYKEHEIEWRQNVKNVFGTAPLTDGDSGAKMITQRTDTFTLSNIVAKGDYGQTVGVGSATSYTGTLVGVAINCEIKNCYVYTEDKTEGEPAEYANKLSGIISGGLVGFALGTNGSAVGTTITNCLAATQTVQDGGSVYCGGLVGLTMGKVAVQNCYGAGYYAAGCNGGLVALAVPHGTVNLNIEGGEPEHLNLNGDVTIHNCYGAGVAYFSDSGVQIGGLIGDVGQKEVPPAGLTVENCYAALYLLQSKVNVKPKVFGTFAGDSKNDYIVQKKTNYNQDIAYEEISGNACNDLNKLTSDFKEDAIWKYDNMNGLFPNIYFIETGQPVVDEFPYPRLKGEDGKVMPQYGYWLMSQ